VRLSPRTLGRWFSSPDLFECRFRFWPNAYELGETTAKCERST